MALINIGSIVLSLFGLAGYHLCTFGVPGMASHRGEIAGSVSSCFVYMPWALSMVMLVMTYARRNSHFWKSRPRRGINFFKMTSWEN